MSPGDSTVLFRALPTATRLSLPERKEIRQFAARLTREVTAPRTFTSLLTGDRELERLNRQFLGHSYATDVLSFPLVPPAADLGEIAISVERAAAQAAEFGHSRLAEIQILMLHGVLHLTGLDHESDDGQMAAAEERWRRQLGLPLALIHRSRFAPCERLSEVRS